MLPTDEMNSYILRERQKSYSDELNELISKHQFETSSAKRIELNNAIREKINNRGCNTIYLFKENTETFKTIRDLDLSGLDLSNVDFSHTNLININFSRCDLTGASMRGRDRKKRNQITADFCEAKCEKLDCTATDLRESIFDENTTVDEMKISDARLSRSNVQFFAKIAKCRGEQKAKFNLDNISLEDVDLSNIDLSYLYLRRVYFRNCNFLRVKLEKTDIESSVFKEAKNLPIGQLLQCLNLGRATFDAPVLVKITEAKSNISIAKFLKVIDPVSAENKKRKRVNELDHSNKEESALENGECLKKIKAR